ncbi:MAG: hypothetical protein IPP46_18515 [Bacteroidetes bacterium]|nr:hypothetical protein [Bacteroidota bacterium]
MVSEVFSPNGLVKDSGYFYSLNSDMHPSNLGFFGVVEDANYGLITITPLDTNIQSQTQSLVNGSFLFGF